MSEVEKIVRSFRLRKTKTADVTTSSQSQTQVEMGSGMNNMLALGSFVAGLIQRPTIVLGGSYNHTYTIGYNITYNQDGITFQLSYLS